MPDRPRHRWQNLAPAHTRAGLRVTPKATVGDDDLAVDLFIYDYIDAWGDEWGISAAMVAKALGQIGAGAINVRINSPGGDYFEGVAIANMLRRHDGLVTVYVDGLAASAASVIAMAGEEILMGVGSQLMIHEASTLTAGTAGDLRKTADVLDQTNDDIAAVYAAKAGGDAATFRAQMAEETWLTAPQAVAAGLATSLAGVDQAPALEAAETTTAEGDGSPLLAPPAATGEPVVEDPERPAPRPAALSAADVSNVEHLPANQQATQTPDAPASDALPVETALPTAPPVNLSELLCSAIREGVTL